MLFGRTAERAAMQEVLGGGALLLTGEPGVGKSALLEDARERHGGLVVATTGVEAEEHLAFAALGDVTRPLLEHLPLVAPPRAAALEVALGLREGSTPDPFAVSAATLDLLLAAGRVLVVVDDLHWLDAASADVLGYVARRLHGGGPALLAATRPGPRLAGVPEVLVAGLGAEHALALLAEGGLTGPTARAVVLQAQGNPLALLEIPAELSADERAGRAPLPDPLPVGPELASVYAARVSRLPAATSDGLALLALHGSGAPAELEAAAADVGMRPGALEAAEAAGLLTRRDAALVFAHPLARAAAVDAAGPARVRELRRALGARTSGAARAWHLAAAAEGPDESVAAELERFGVDAEAAARSRRPPRPTVVLRR